MLEVGLAGNEPREALRPVVLEGRVLLTGGVFGGAPREALRLVVLEGRVLLTGELFGGAPRPEDTTPTSPVLTFDTSEFTRFELIIAVLSDCFWVSFCGHLGVVTRGLSALTSGPPAASSAAAPRRLPALGVFAKGLSPALGLFAKGVVVLHLGCCLPKGVDDREQFGDARAAVAPLGQTRERLFTPAGAGCR